MRYKIETERETDGRWIAHIENLPGCAKYGDTESEARRKCAALALAILSDRVEQGETHHEGLDLFEPVS